MSEYSGKAQSASPLAQTTNTIGGHIGELDVHTKRLYEILQQLTNVGDRLLGTRPEPVAKDGGAETPAGSITLALQRRDREASTLIGAISEAASRIESALGDFRG